MAARRRGYRARVQVGGEVEGRAVLPRMLLAGCSEKRGAEQAAPRDGVAKLVRYGPSRRERRRDVSVLRERAHIRARVSPRAQDKLCSRRNGRAVQPDPAVRDVQHLDGNARLRRVPRGAPRRVRLFCLGCESPRLFASFFFRKKSFRFIFCFFPRYRYSLVHITRSKNPHY